MKISLNWLREYVDFAGTPDELASLLTMAGVEVESIESRGGNLDKVVVAQILSREQHPNADRLGVCKVDDGSGQPPRQIVCGATNYKVGDKVPLALPGAVLPGDFKIKVGKLRGVESEGMLCSAKELRLADDAAGLFILGPDTPVGMPIRELFPADTIIEIEVTPNRSDLLSHVGLAREVAALGGGAFKHPLEGMETPPGGEPVPPLPVMIAANAREACPYYTARVIDDVQVGPSPDWLRSRLESIGLRSINNVVDVTNYVMMELGQPLHAFDAAKVGLSGIGVRFASPGEELKALDGRTHKLQPHHLVIAQVSDEKAVGEAPEGLAGVMGGEDSGVTAATKTIIVESAYFTPAGVRRTSRELGLSSDASYRFERGVDPEGVLGASRRAEDLLLQICGGNSQGVVQTLHFEDYAPGAARLNQPVTLRLAKVEQMLGEPMPQERIDEILTGFGLEKVEGKEPEEGEAPPAESAWTVPSYRHDLKREIDLIEEIVRVHGLDKVASRGTAWMAPSSPEDREYDYLMGLKRRLVGMGFAEARNGALTSQAAGAGGAPLKNPLNEENAVLRNSLLPGLLATAGRNARLGTSDLRLFESGRVFTPDTEAAKPEPSHLSLLLTGAAQPNSWRHGGGARNTDVHDLRGVIEVLLAPAAIEFASVEPPAGSPVVFAGKITLDGQEIGGLGQMSPAWAKEYELRGDVFVADLKLRELFAAQAGAGTFKPLARFPAVTRDLAVVVDHGVAHGQIEAILREAKEPLLTGVELFDVFRDDKGEKIAADKKSLAYSLTYRAEDRTLRTEEVNAAHTRLKDALRGAFSSLQFRE